MKESVPLRRGVTAPLRSGSTQAGERAPQETCRARLEDNPAKKSCDDRKSRPAPRELAEGIQSAKASGRDRQACLLLRHGAGESARYFGTT